MRARPAPRRVVVTGIGVVSPAGIGLDPFWKGLQIPPADRRQRTIDEFDPSPWLSPKQARHQDRFTQFPIAAADMALRRAPAKPSVASTLSPWAPRCSASSAKFGFDRSVP